MKNLMITTLILLFGFTAKQSPAQCTATVTGDGCEGTILAAHTTGGTLQQLLWNWKSREDSVVSINTVSVFYSAGIVSAGGNGAGDANNQCSPEAIYVDKAGNLFLVDAFNSRVQKWAPNATEGITIAGGNGRGSDANQLSFPSDIQVDETGNIYISDGGNNRIQKWIPGAKEGITIAGGPDKLGAGPDQFNGPSGIFLDAENNLYIVDEFNYRVQKWAPGAKEGIMVAGGNGEGNALNQISEGKGIFVDSKHNIYVADGGYINNRIEKWAPDAKEAIIVAGTGRGNSSKQLDNPYDVYVDDLGSVYVADSRNDRIQKWMPGVDSGITVVGTPNGLTFCTSVFLNGDSIYVAESGTFRVQKFIPDAEIPQIDSTYKPVNGGNYTATAKFKEGCAATSPSVHVKGLPKFKNIMGQKRNLCGGGTFTYSVNAVGEAEIYTWTAPEGCSILSGQGTSSITLSIPATGFSSGVLSVSADNKCGTGPVFYDTLSTKPVQPGTIKGPVTVATYATVNYSVVPEPGITYHWEIPVAGVVITGGQNTASITVAWNSFESGNVIVKASACSNGSASKNRLAVTVTSSALNAANGSENIAVKNTNTLKVYPNPAQNKATVAFTAKGNYNIQLSDATGKLIKNTKGNAVAGENKVDIDLSRLSKGMYFVTLIAENKKQVATLSKQ